MHRDRTTSPRSDPNHPTAVHRSPAPRRARAVDPRRRRDGPWRRAQAGLTGFTTSNLRLPGLPQPWEAATANVGKPARISSALDIAIQGPIGGAAFNDEFGRPNLGGYFRTFEQQVGDTVYGYHKPIA